MASSGVSHPAARSSAALPCINCS